MLKILVRLCGAFLLFGVLVGTLQAQTDIPLSDEDQEYILAEINERREAEDLEPFVLSDDATVLAQEMLAIYQEDFDTRVDLRDLLDETGIVASSITAPTLTVSGDLDDYMTDLFRRMRSSVFDDSYTDMGVVRGEWEEDQSLYVMVLLFPNQCGPEEEAASFELQLAQAEEFLTYINEGRAERDLEPLTLAMDEGMYAATRWYSDDMKEFGYPTVRPGGVAHIGTDGSDPAERLDREGYAYVSVRENILFQFQLDALEAYTGWFNSPPHFRNMMADDVTEMALAYTCNPENGRFYYTQVLGTPFVQEDPNERAVEIIAAFDVARADASLAPLELVSEAGEYLNEVAAYINENDDTPSDLWDTMNTDYGYNGGNVLWISSNRGIEETSTILLDYYGRNIVREDITRLASGIYFDETENAYLHVFVIGEN